MLKTRIRIRGRMIDPAILPIISVAVIGAGVKFFLQDVSDGLALTAENTIATVAW